MLPLLWRRRRPLAAFGTIAAVFVLQWSLGAALRADVALFIALYSLALHGQLRQLPWACGIMAAGTVLVAVRASAAVSVWDALFFLLSTATAALALGLMVRTRRAQLAGCGSGRPAWRSNVTSAAGSRPPPSGRGWPVRCTTSSATTWPS